LIISQYRIKPNEIWVQLKRAIHFLFLGKAESIDKSKWTLLALSFCFLFGVAIYQRLAFSLVKSSAIFEPSISVTDFLEDYEGQEVKLISIDSSDASEGAKNAKIQLVVYSDFECPYCSSFAMETRKWSQKYRDNLNIVFKHFPLSKICNESLEDDIHPSACRAAIAAQAAHYQGKFWEFHDALFASELSNFDVMTEAERLNLDPRRYIIDLEQAEQKVRKDIARRHVKRGFVIYFKSNT
jgi:hypothetical protein